MNNSASLASIVKIHQQEVERAQMLAVQSTDTAQQLVAQLDKLRTYTREYGYLSDGGAQTRPHLYQDQQLFIRRLNNNIHLLETHLVEAQQSVERTMVALTAAQLRADVLKRTLEKVSIKEEKARQLLIQKECDESVRMTSTRTSKARSFR